MLGPLCYMLITIVNYYNRLLFKNGILNIRKRLGMTKVRPHRTTYKENLGTPSEGSTIVVTAADQLVCIQTGRNTTCDQT